MLISSEMFKFLCLFDACNMISQYFFQKYRQYLFNCLINSKLVLFDNIFFSICASYAHL